MVWLGTVSYGVYLWQIPVRRLLDPAPASAPPLNLAHTAALLLATAAGSVALAAASWYGIERPAQRLQRRDRHQALERPGVRYAGLVRSSRLWPSFGSEK